MATTKAVSYVRVSGKGQADGDGPERQRQAIARFAKSSGLLVVEEYSDLGVSGTKELADRPGLARLLDRIESNGVRVVVVERADRVARDLMVQEVIVGQFAKLGARIITCDGVDLTSSGRSDPSADSTGSRMRSLSLKRTSSF
jgi:DNA invertase Pin-like site-specific DNA recombinase